MAYICRARYATMSELANMFGVSTRTIKRDIDELGYLIPIETRSGRYEGGVYVMDNYRWDKVYMSDEEIELLTKIKMIGFESEKLILEDFELKTLESIITTYSMPKKVYSNPDTDCQG